MADNKVTLFKTCEAVVHHPSDVKTCRQEMEDFQINEAPERLIDPDCNVTVQPLHGTYSHHVLFTALCKGTLKSAK